MAIGDVTSKRLFQGYLSPIVTALYTAPANTNTQIVEIWADNQNVTTDRNVNLYSPGVSIANRLVHNIPVKADTGISISDNKITLNSGEVFAMSQDIGNDVLVTMYGIEEVVAE
ncbi:hypothetical protein [Clostridium kluyveri]|uniref:hypothetical protein n=1 Tax=Clostridium kluyveri TaxID=1534 RepID=UPI00224826D1|nr:hypothetical protein [Clostridium kluyveri]UZQ49872.1 hypothetical protein OP486_18280 [Clostridium kluyveri]